MKQYKKYTDIPKKYTFDLEHLIDGGSIEEMINQLIHEYEKLIEIKDSKYDDKDTYLQYLNSQESTTILMNKIANYISNNISVNVVSNEFNKISEELNFKMFEIQKKLGSETNRIFKNEKKLREWVKLPEFANYKKDLLHTLEMKKHKFSDPIEEFIKRISRAEISAYDVFEIITNSELNYGFAKSSSGKKIKITPANRTKLLQSKDEEVRKSTYTNWANAFLQHKNSLSSLLYQHIKSISVWSLERKYNSTIESIIEDDKVDLKLLETLYSSAKNNNYLFQNYYKAKRTFFESKFNKKFKPWDSMMSLVKIKEDYSIEETQEIVAKALKPLGSEYSQMINKMFKERWVDYCVVDNKRSGAYSIGQSYGLEKKYILMNHDGKFHSVSTLAHEAGHSMHSWYSDNNQPFNLSSYPIFLAEIASIFNELLLNDYMMENTKDEKVKFALLGESIEEFEATVRRQTMWSEYEFNLYNAIDKGQPCSTFDQIKEIYKDVAKKYSLVKNPKLDKDIQLYPSVMVPHFYYEFYVYKYAIGYLVANYFFQQYKTNGKSSLENYINNFLKQGGSKWPTELLKEAGVDLYDPNFYKQAFKELENKIAQYTKLGKKIFK